MAKYRHKNKTTTIYIACWKIISIKEAFQYPTATLSQNIANPDSSLRQQQQKKQSYSSQPNYERLPII